MNTKSQRRNTWVALMLSMILCCSLIMPGIQAQAAGEIFPKLVALTTAGDVYIASGGSTSLVYQYTRGNFTYERCVMKIYSGSDVVVNYQENMYYISADYAGHNFTWTTNIDGKALGDGVYTMEVYSMVFDGSKWLENYAGHIVSRVYVGTTKTTTTQDASYYAPVFNANYFYNHNPDVAAAIGYDEAKLLAFFIKQGMAEGRRGSANFDMEIYRYWNRDLLLTYANDYEKYYTHFLNYGQYEGRIANETQVPKS